MLLPFKMEPVAIRVFHAIVFLSLVLPLKLIKLVLVSLLDIDNAYKMWG